MKQMILMLSLASLLPLGSVSAAVDGGNEDRAANFRNAVEKLRSVKVIGGSATGFTLTPGEFFTLAQECLKNGTREDFKGLLEDRNPVVRVMGLVCLAQSDQAAYAEVAEAHKGDSAAVSYMIGCVIRHATVGRIAERLVKEPFFLGREAGQLPASAEKS